MLRLLGGFYHAGLSSGHARISTAPVPLQISPTSAEPRASAIARGNDSRACPFALRVILLLKISSFSGKFDHLFILKVHSKYIGFAVLYNHRQKSLSTFRQWDTLGVSSWMLLNSNLFKQILGPLSGSIVRKPSLIDINFPRKVKPSRLATTRLPSRERR